MAAEATLTGVKITPLGDRVLVRPLEKEESRKSGLIIPDTATPSSVRYPSVEFGSAYKNLASSPRPRKPGVWPRPKVRTPAYFSQASVMRAWRNSAGLIGSPACEGVNARNDAARVTSGSARRSRRREVIKEETLDPRNTRREKLRVIGGNGAAFTFW